MSDAGMPRYRFWLVQGVTLARIPLALAFAALLFYDASCLAVIVAGTVMLALMELSDALDGVLARRLGLVTEWGAILDPYADSVSRITVYWALASAQLTFMAIPWTMAFRDITVAYCRIIWARHGKSGSARLSGKIKAIVQGTGGFFLLLSPVLFPQDARRLMLAVSWIVLLVTLASLAEYVGTTVGAARRPESAKQQ